MIKHTLLLSLIILFFSFNTIKEVPPGTVQISENLFIDENEITNLSWQEYVNWNLQIFGEDSKEYKESLPNVEVWQSETLKQNYFSHPKFVNFPVVGITYEQAVSFCSWRSDRVNEVIFAKAHSIDMSFENYSSNYKSGKFKMADKLYVYRLPTKQEWENIAGLGYSKKIVKKIEKNRNNVTLYNVSRGTPMFPEDDLTAPVGSFFPNEKGVYDILGNVAEMISQKGIAKGGSYRQKLDKDITKDYTYTVASDWVGFRCICEKINK